MFSLPRWGLHGNDGRYLRYGDTDLCTAKTPETLALPAGPREHFDIKGKWQGHVVSVGEETFTAIIKDVLGQSSDEEVEIYLEEISPR